MDYFDYYDYLDDDAFNPQNLDHWLLVLCLVGLVCYGLWLAFTMPDSPKKPSHRYNRKTGKIERNDD